MTSLTPAERKARFLKARADAKMTRLEIWTFDALKARVKAYVAKLNKDHK